MDYFHLDYGMMAKAPDLIESVPALQRLKNLCPEYIQKAEEDQRLARRFAREEIAAMGTYVPLKGKQMMRDYAEPIPSQGNITSHTECESS